MNNIKIGYYKAPIHWFLQSSVAKGKFCGTTRHIPFQVPMNYNTDVL